MVATSALCGISAEPAHQLSRLFRNLLVTHSGLPICLLTHTRAASLLWLALSPSHAAQPHVPSLLLLAPPYAGEVTLQSLMLLYGAWIPQEVARSAGGGELLLEARSTCNCTHNYRLTCCAVTVVLVPQRCAVNALLPLCHMHCC